jgi:hypothetical protein
MGPQRLVRKCRLCCHCQLVCVPLSDKWDTPFRTGHPHCNLSCIHDACYCKFLPVQGLWFHHMFVVCFDCVCSFRCTLGSLWKLLFRIWFWRHLLWFHRALSLHYCLWRRQYMWWLVGQLCWLNDVASVNERKKIESHVYYQFILSSQSNRSIHKINDDFIFYLFTYTQQQNAYNWFFHWFCFGFICKATTTNFIISLLLSNMLCLGLGAQKGLVHS